MTLARVSIGTRIQDNRWRSVIRIFAVVAALFGLALIGNEIVENVTCNGVAFCSKIHLGTMLWGIVLLSLGLLILQKGDVSLSLKEIAETGTVVRGWWGRRSYDKTPPIVAATARPSVPVVVTADLEKDERIARPEYQPRGID